VKYLHRLPKLPAILCAGSFLFLVIFCSLTNPIENISLTVVFFLAALVLLVSLGHLLTYLRKGIITRKARYRIIVSSIFILTLLMFRSAQSLSAVDILILILIVFGLIFYSSSRRAK